VSRVTRALLAAAAAALLWPLLAGAAPVPPQVLAVSVARPAGPPDVATGFAAGPGRVVTVAHVLEREGRVIVRTADGAVRTAAVLRVDRRTDLAVLAVPGLRSGPLRLAEGGRAARVLVPGAGRAAVVRREIVARVHAAGAPVAERPALELAADVAVGDSGAPVVARDGRVLGVVFARSRVRPGTAYAVDADAVRALVG